uniref:C2H2-type domain-containing protein n=1 Tax=Sander lucioperca TaxID=283035 RepID=A0A8D0CTA9_SANLU
MCKVQMLRALVEQRLTAAAEEIFGLFERTIAEYEEELCRSKEENERQRELLDAVYNPQLRLHRAALPPDEKSQIVIKEEQEEPELPPHIKEEQEEMWSSQEGEQLQGLEEADITKFPFTPVPVKSEDDEERDVEQLSGVKEEVPPEQQEYSSSVDQQEPEPPPHIKEEQEELWSSQEGEQLQGLEEADITKFPFTPVPVKSEDDEEEAQSSQLHQRQTQHMVTEADGEDCGGPEPARNSHPDPLLQPETEDQTGDSSEPETDDSADWKETREPQSALNSLKHDSRCKKRFSCSECGRRFGQKGNLNRHMITHTGEKPFSCSVCNESFTRSENVRSHMRTHTGEKPFSCSVCKKSFTQSGDLLKHMRTHTGEKPFSCSICKKSFTERGSLRSHMVVHTGEKLFSCPVCKKSFTERGSLRSHMVVHTGEKPFSCSVCNKSFTQRGSLQSHMVVHTGEKPFSCSVCKKSFTQRGSLRSHMAVVHIGEKRFSCSVCNKRFSRRSHVKTHKCVGQMVTEADGEDCGGPEPARNSHPHPLLQPETEDQTGDSSEHETDDME